MWRIAKKEEEEEEEEEIAQNALISVINLVYAWKIANFIELIKMEDNTKANLTVTNI